MNRTLVFEITEDYASIFAFFQAHHFPRRISIQLKQNPGRVVLNGADAMLKTPLKPGDTLRLQIMEEEGSAIVPTPMKLDIVFEDADILVLNKPARMPTHPSLQHYEDTLANGLMHYYADEDSPFVFRCMNRLDRDTSGLTVIAKNPYSSAMLQRQAKSRELHRTYLAIVEGALNDMGVIDAPIGRIRDSVILRGIDYENGQPAMTHYTCLEQKNGLSLASIQLKTGRTHQIRVHMASIGHPLPGDFLYNPENQMISRQALHSHRLDFRHPVTEEPLAFVVPMPDDMHRLFYGE